MGFLTTGSSSILSWLIESTVHATVLICLILLIKVIIRRKLPAWWTYRLWMLLIVRMLIPFSFKTPVSIINYFHYPIKNESYMPLPMENGLIIPFPFDGFNAGNTMETDINKSVKNITSVNENITTKESDISHLAVSTS